MTEILAKEEMTMTPINTLFDGAAPQGRMFAAASSVFAAVKSSHDVVTVAIDQPAHGGVGRTEIVTGRRHIHILHLHSRLFDCPPALSMDRSGRQSSPAR